MDPKNSRFKVSSLADWAIFSSLWKSLGRISRHKVLSVFIVGILAFFGCALVGLVEGFPIPRIHDEFSNLLAADTFLHGRLTNPTHPMWVHFESFHVLQRPTYMSKYFPAQGLIMALGKIIFGHPVFGVYLSMALMCAAVCWMLQAWMPPRWAFIGGLAVLLHPNLGIAGNFAQSYFGSCIAAFGSALFFGGFRRIIKEPKMWDAFMMGVGTAVLAISRPFEGLIIILPAMGVLFLWILFKSREHTLVTIMRRVVMPFLIVMGMTMVAMGYYNKSITGDIFTTPYKEYEATYSNSPMFVWERIRPVPVFRNDIMADFNNKKSLMNYYDNSKFMTRIFKSEKEIQLVFMSSSFYDIPLFCSLLFLILGERWMFFVYFNVVVFWVLTTLSYWFSPYYTSVLVSLYAIMWTQGLRVLSFLSISRKKKVGRILVIFCMCFFIVLCIQKVKLLALVNDTFIWDKERVRLIHYVQRFKLKNLIIVHYGKTHDVHREWVYNGADIDNAPVVWARDMDKIQNQKLIEYFKDRQVWVLDIENYDQSFDLKPYQ